MATDLKGFASRMRKISEHLEKEVDKTVLETSLEVLREVVVRTPVDTGLARGNWQVSLDSAPNGVVDTKGGNIAIRTGSMVIHGYQTGAVYIANNLPYIQRLNDGHSKQAPANFVESGVQRAIKVIRASKLIK